MASKKYTLVLALLGLLQTATFAQTLNDASDSYVFDSSKVSTKNMAQYNEFKNNQYPYPARPKDSWELGGGFGLGFILGDIPLLAKGPAGGSNLGGPTGTLSLRKSLNHTWSLRGSYAGSIISMPSYKDVRTNALDRSPATRNYTHMLSIDAIASLNTASYYRGNPKTNIYALLGYSIVATKVRSYFQNGVNGAGYYTRYYPVPKNFITTFGPKSGADPNGRGAWGVMHAADLGAGIAFRLSPKFNIALESKVIIPIVGNDFLDGADLGKSGDSYSYSTFRVNMNLGTKSGTRVEPLWWINPNNYVYNEVNIPKHMKIPPPVLPDADGDGVTDQFDLEPNTPAGAAVDSHGRAKDTDGDGVPDYKDKEVLTQQSCFPVNADGVGTCPEPACCKELRELVGKGGIQPANQCAISSLPSVTFKAGSAKLSKDASSILSGAASQLQANPNCKVKVVGYVSDMTSKRQQQLSWDRVNAVIKYLVEKAGISESRIIFSYENTGDSNTVDLQPTTEQGPNTVPAPHPQYRTTK